MTAYLGVGVVADPEGSLNIVCDVPDKVQGVLNGLGVEVLLLVGGHHDLRREHVLGVQLY